MRKFILDYLPQCCNSAFVKVSDGSCLKIYMVLQENYNII